MTLDDHHKGTVVAGPDLQGRRVAGHRVGIARHHVQDGSVGGVGLRIHQTLPGVNEVARRDLLAVRPVDIIAEGEGIRLGAVHVVGIGIAGGLRGGKGTGGVDLHQIFKQLGVHGLFRFGDGQRRIQRVGRVHQCGADGHMLRLRFAAGGKRQRHAQRQKQGE